jgi:preprotein translocase subunit SecY
MAQVIRARKACMVQQFSSAAPRARGRNMQKLLSAVVFFLMSLPVLAATKEMEGTPAPVETVDMVYVIIFCLIFVGMIVGFFIYLFMNDKKEKSDAK